MTSNLLRHCIFRSVWIILVLFLKTASSFASLQANTPVPLFELKDINGTSYNLDGIKREELFILYFFDAASLSSREGVIAVDSLVKQYSGKGFTVWGVTRSSREEIDSFISEFKPSFPILIDHRNISKQYDVGLILPTALIIGPELRLMNFIQGGGKGTEKMLVSLAERMLQKKESAVAKAISEKVVKHSPENIDAKVVMGYAELKTGNMDGAESIFKELSRMEGVARILGEEGLAVLYSQKGDSEKALSHVKSVERSGKKRALIHVVKGGIFYSQNQIPLAEAEYRKAIALNDAQPEHVALAFNQLGRILAMKGEYEKSREKYDEAVDIDPYLIEATSNKGFTYEREGNWAKALETYQKIQSENKNDVFSAVLAEKAQNMLNIQRDSGQKDRIDKLVKELAERYRKQQRVLSKMPQDSWTSQPMVLSFANISESGGLPIRDGFSSVIMAKLGDQLNQSGRVRVVERVVMDRLLEELNMGSSDLSDPSTVLRLGKILSAKILGTGTLFHLASGSLLSLRLIDTETSHVSKVFNIEFQSEQTIRDAIYQLNREILSSVITDYPLRAFIVEAKGNEVIVNLGARQGVVRGTRFNVIEEKKTIEYKGKRLNQSPDIIASIEVTRIEDDFSHGKVIKSERPVKRDDKLVEYMEPYF